MKSLIKILNISSYELQKSRAYNFTNKLKRLTTILIFCIDFFSYRSVMLVNWSGKNLFQTRNNFVTVFYRSWSVQVPCEFLLKVFKKVLLTQVLNEKVPQRIDKKFDLISSRGMRNPHYLGYVMELQKMNYWVSQEFLCREVFH